MSWITRLEQIELTITTGDGKKYKPLWKSAQKNINYNVEGFDYVGLEGTFVERNKVQGTQYPITLYFSGENCIDVMNAFEISSRDSRAWTISHPFYDDIFVQPLSLNFDNSELNVAKIEGVVWETLNQRFPDSLVNTQKEIEVAKKQADTDIVSVFVEEVETPPPSLPQKAVAAIQRIQENYSSLPTTSKDVENLKNLVKTATSAAQEMVSNTQRYIESAITLINFPSTIKQNIEQKIVALLNSISELAAIFVTDTSTNVDYLTYEVNSMAIYTELSNNIVKGSIDRYLTRANILAKADEIIASYDHFLTTLDAVLIKGYSQNAQLAQQLDYIINTAVSKTYDISFDAKQERSIILSHDDNLVTLAHRYLGPGDDNIELLASQNNIGLKEYILLKKGRKIIYYT